MSDRMPYRVVVAPLFAAGLALLVTGCSSTNSTVDNRLAFIPAKDAAAAEPAFTYHHWPEANVYLDVNREVFFWMESGQAQSGSELPAQVMDGLGGAVVVKRDTADPFAGSGFASVETQ